MALASALAVIAGGLIWFLNRDTGPTLGVPFGLATVRQGTGTVVLSWNAPPGLAVDEYVIVRDGETIASVPGTQLQYTDSTVAPSTSYAYSVAARAEDSQSAASQPIQVITAEPTLAEARLGGSFDVNGRLTSSVRFTQLHKGDRFSWTWTFTPTGPSGVRLQGTSPGGDWSVKLRAKGATYQGRTKVSLSSCNFVPATDTVTVKIRVLEGNMVDGTWTAVRWTGTLTDVAEGTTAGLFVCPGSRFTAAVRGALIT